MTTTPSATPQNIDHEEIAKFEAVASRWWDLEGEFKPLHRINPLRLMMACLEKMFSMSAAVAAF
ncbi:bifunctional 3-demethylubiquinone-9 3-methyltransferase/ 2-octaprenyl-6-hydroxy phenol methylase [Rahnella aquatilis HX2]|nr:bifunctional 3-demethylubiquinone-9 3-methyltransferase/ 2-octaprenyl-6-hydroxy phenol methylase [Rahnella aquatilis HX2]